jgi:hypothetical protein
LRNRIDRYEQENPIDAVAWLKAKAALENNKKIKKIEVYCIATFLNFL